MRDVNFEEKWRQNVSDVSWLNFRRLQIQLKQVSRVTWHVSWSAFLKVLVCPNCWLKKLENVVLCGKARNLNLGQGFAYLNLHIWQFFSRLFWKDVLFSGGSCICTCQNHFSLHIRPFCKLLSSVVLGLTTCFGYWRLDRGQRPTALSFLEPVCAKISRAV